MFGMKNPKALRKAQKRLKSQFTLPFRRGLVAGLGRPRVAGRLRAAIKNELPEVQHRLRHVGTYLDWQIDLGKIPKNKREPYMKIVRRSYPGHD
ncbi:MAG: hypothetical protein Q7R47_03225, partial [Candidatus Diapherotrites archaeon]|nr:hypothetical protein [Candidatus Diapherotrites archaeon]